MYSMAESTSGPIYSVTRVRTLDELLEAERLEVCHLLKIDVEKLELKVLQGGPKTLRLTRQVVIEADKENAIHEQVLALLKAAGFECSIEDETPGGIVVYARRG